MKLFRQTEQWTILALILVALLSIALLQWNYVRWKSSLDDQIAAQDSITQAKLNLTRSYLVTEQIANGDPTQPPQYAFAYLDQAESNIRSWPDSLADVRTGRVDDDAAFSAMLSTAADLLKPYRIVVTRSIQGPQQPSTELTIDRKLAFSALEHQIDIIEQQLYQHFDAHSQQRQQQHIATLVCWTLFLAALDLLIYQALQARHSAVAALTASEERFRTQYKGIPVPTYTWQHQQGQFILRSYNDAAEQLAPESIPALLGKCAQECYHDRPDILADFAQCFQTHTTIQREIAYNFHAPEPIKDIFVSYVFVPPDLVMVHNEDRTERNQLAAQLTQAQKMESVGRLAGGIAHDFNNILTAISGYSALAVESLPEHDPTRNDIREIQRAAERAARLTSQLLAFARKQALQASNIDLNDLIATMANLFRRVLPENIKMQIHPERALGVVWADAGQIEQVLLNLVLNARDAMPDGGEITIETSNIYLDDLYTRQRVDIATGHYVLLAVSDTGTGMTADVQQQAFDPFFTTKGPTQGSGLGLAMCYGIIKQHKGHIAIYSEIGHGTTIKIYMPRQEAEAETQEYFSLGVPPVGNETILFVEDDEQVRSVVIQMLSRLGYHVLSADHGAGAIALAQRYRPGDIQMLITDVVMPEMSGRELSTKIRELDPKIKILFISGYSENILPYHQKLGDDVALLSKPFSAAELAHKIRSLL